MTTARSDRPYPSAVPRRCRSPTSRSPQRSTAPPRHWPDRVAVDFLGATTTYRELADTGRAWRPGPASTSASAPGDRVAIAMPNCTAHVVAFYAVLRIGAVVVEHNPTYTAGELAHQLADSGAVVALVWEKAVPRVLAVAGRRPRCATSSPSTCPPTCRARSRLALRLPVPTARRTRAAMRGPVPPAFPTWHQLVAARRAPAGRPPAPAAVGHRRSCSTPAAPRARPRAPMLTHAQPRRERRAGPGLDRRRARAPRRLRRPAVLPRVRPDAVPDVRDPDRRDARRVPLVRPRPRARRPAPPARHVHARRPADARPPRRRRRGAGRGPHLLPLRDQRRDGAARARPPSAGSR